MNIKKIFIIFFIIVALCFESFFGVLSITQFFIQSTLVISAWVLFKVLISSKNRENWKYLFISSYIWFLSVFGLFTSIFLSFLLYQNSVPGTIPEVHFTYGDQDIVFVGMSHIATPSFYQQRKDTLTALSQSGYTVLFEGVRPGTPENEKIFQSALGFQLTPSSYKNIGSFLGFVSQDNTYLLSGVSSGSLLSVDLTIDEIIGLLHTKNGNTINADSSIPLDDIIQEAQNTLSEREGWFLSWTVRAFLNSLLKSSIDMDQGFSVEQKNLFQIIIDERNRRVVEYIQSHPKQKIAIVYGSMHLNGILEELQRSKDIQFITMKNSTPYR